MPGFAQGGGGGGWWAPLDLTDTLSETKISRPFKIMNNEEHSDNEFYCSREEEQAKLYNASAMPFLLNFYFNNKPLIYHN